MSKLTIPDEICATQPKPSHIYTLVNPPPPEAMRKAVNVFCGMGGNSFPPILTGSASERLRQSSRIRTVLEGSRPPGGVRLDKLLPDFFQFLQYYGVLVGTNAISFTHVLDKDRAHMLARGEHIPSEMLTLAGRDKRLREILELPPKELPGKAAPSKEAEVLDQAEVRRVTTEIARDRFNGLSDAFPELTDMAQTLGVLAAHAAKGRKEGLVEATDQITRSVLAMRTRIDDDALRLIDELTAITTATPPTPTLDFHREIQELQRQKKPLDTTYAALARAKNEADDQLEHLRVEIIENDLEQQLRFTEDMNDRQRLELAIERAQVAATTLEHHIDALLELMNPLKTQVDRIQKRITALTVINQPFEVTHVATPNIPEAPDIDEEVLLNWRSLPDPSTLEEETSPEADDIDLQMETNSPTDAPNWGLGWEPGKLTPQHIAAIFALVGKRSAAKVALALRELGLIQTRVQLRWIFNVCVGMAKEDAPEKLLRFCGSMSGLRIYMAAKDLPSTIVDELIPPELQQRLRELIMAKPKATT